MSTARLDLRAAPDIDASVLIVRNFAAERRDKILIGFGASAHSVAEGRLIERADLDKACPDRPVFIVKYDGHAAIVNAALLALLPEKIKSVRGFAPETGLLTQEAFFRVTDFVTGTVSLPATLSGMLRAVDAMAEKGVGMIHSVTGVGFPADLDVTLESIFARGLRNELPYRVFFQTMDTAKALKRKLPRIGGCFATALQLALLPLRGLDLGFSAAAAATGSSGSGASPSLGTHHPLRAGDFRAYKILNHQHLAEVRATMNQCAIQGQLAFVPQSAPLVRGIFATVQAVESLGAGPVALRAGTGKDGPVLSESGGILADLLVPTDVVVTHALDGLIRGVGGVMDTGYFAPSARRRFVTG